jgi:hypothetical protein
MKIPLTPDLLKQAHELGTRRDSNHIGSGSAVGNSTVVHTKGCKGEVAFAHAYDVAVDTEDRPSGDDGDFEVCWVGQEEVIDVKVTDYHDDPWLKVRPCNLEKADRYVLASLIGDTVIELHGHMTSRELARQPITDKTGHFDNHIVEQSELNPMPPTEWVA